MSETEEQPNITTVKPDTSARALQGAKWVGDAVHKLFHPEEKPGLMSEQNLRKQFPDTYKLADSTKQTKADTEALEAQLQKLKQNPTLPAESSPQEETAEFPSVPSLGDGAEDEAVNQAQQIISEATKQPIK